MKTVGSILKNAREKKGLSHKEIFQVIKIHPRFLQALEASSWGTFASSVHAKGFLKNYAEYLGLNVDEVLAFFRREYNEKQSGQTLKNVIRPLATPRLVVTPGLVLTIATLLFVTVFLGYVIYQYRSFAGAPILIIDEPRTDLTTADPLLNVVGRTDPDATISLNGQQINVGEKGTFSAHLTLAEGVNTLNFTAENKLGRKNKVTRTVVVRPAAPLATEQGQVEATAAAKPKIYEGIEVAVRVGPNTAWLTVRADGREVFEGLLAAGVSKTFTAEEKIFLRTGNAGSTKVLVNGVEQESLGKEGEVAEHEYQK